MTLLLHDAASGWQLVQGEESIQKRLLVSCGPLQDEPSLAHQMAATATAPGGHMHPQLCLTFSCLQSLLEKSLIGQVRRVHVALPSFHAR